MNPDSPFEMTHGITRKLIRFLATWKNKKRGPRVGDWLDLLATADVLELQRLCDSYDTLDTEDSTNLLGPEVVYITESLMAVDRGSNNLLFVEAGDEDGRDTRDHITNLSALCDIELRRRRGAIRIKGKLGFQGHFEVLPTD